jgi:hypothetical protein
MISWEYLAGFIDGEGCIKCYRSGGEYKNLERKKLRPRITIGQKDREVLDEIQTFLGTNLKVTLSYDCHYLQICSVYHVRRILTNILPYLVVKRKDAEEALALLGVERGI